MNRACPHCGKHLEWWRRMRTIRVSGSLLKPRTKVKKCVHCGALIVNNPHPSERWITGTAEFWAVLVLVAWAFAGVGVAGVTAAAVAAIVVALTLRAREQTRNGWPRYKPYDPLER